MHIFSTRKVFQMYGTDYTVGVRRSQGKAGSAEGIGRVWFVSEAKI